jgi:hypothetical protein
MSTCTMILATGQLNDRLGLGMLFAVFRLFSQGFHVDAVGSLVLSNERGSQFADFLLSVPTFWIDLILPTASLGKRHHQHK